MFHPTQTCYVCGVASSSASSSTRKKIPVSVCVRHLPAPASPWEQNFSSPWTPKWSYSPKKPIKEVYVCLIRTCSILLLDQQLLFPSRGISRLNLRQILVRMREGWDWCTNRSFFSHLCSLCYPKNSEDSASNAATRPIMMNLNK